MAKPDIHLRTRDEVMERILSITRQREDLCSRCIGRREHTNAFHKRQSKIARLTEREEALRHKLKEIRRNEL